MNVMDLTARLSLDAAGYNQGLKTAQSNMAGVTQGVGQADNSLQRLSSTMKKIAAGLAIGKTLQLATNAVVKLTKSAVSAFGEFEQLEGGVQTLFKDSADVVMKNAENAYKTAGLSANEYMSTVTSFSASLLQSLGGDTDKAADYADMAIRDMSDNANKMGTDMGMIQSAYAGFAKQNYTMLDNLKLGYGGTKTEMERLIKDANAIRKAQGLNADLTINSYADVITAIHTVQTEMGITGTTAKEASTTIQGSANSMKASWSNLMVAIGRGTGVSTAFRRLRIAAKTYLKNLIPVVNSSLKGIAQLVESLGPVIIRELPGIISNTLPSFLSAVKSLVSTAIKTIPSLLDSLWEAVTGHGGVFSNLFSGASEAWEKAKGKLRDVIDSAKKWFNDTFKPEIESALSGSGINWTNLWKGLETSGLTGALSKVIEDAFAFLTGGGAAKIVTSIARLFNGVNASDLVSNTKTFANTLLTFIGSALSGIGRGATALIQAVGGLFNNLTSEEILGAAGEIGGTIITFLGQAIKGAFGTGTIIVKEIGNLFKNIKAADLLEKAGNFTETIGTFLVDAIKGIGAGAVDLVGALGDLFVDVFSDLTSPETQEAASSFGQKFITMISDAIGAAGDAVKDILDKIVEKLKGLDWATAGQQLWDNIKEFVSGLFSEDGLGKVDWKGVANSIGKFLGLAVSQATDGAVGFALGIAKWILSGEMFSTLGTIARELASGLWSAFTGAVTSIWDNSVIVQYLKDAFGKVRKWMDKALGGKDQYETDISYWKYDDMNYERYKATKNKEHGDMLSDTEYKKAQEASQDMWAHLLNDLANPDMDEATARARLEESLASYGEDMGPLYEEAIRNSGFMEKANQVIEECFGEPLTPELEVDPEIKTTEPNGFDTALEKLYTDNGWDYKTGEPLDSNKKTPPIQVYLDADTTMTEAKNTVANGIEEIKKLVNFDWSLPPLKVPVIKISGGFDLQNLTAPTFSIEWHRKAMQNGMILNSPTIFGAMGGKLLGAGEAGPEAVVGVGSLDRMIRESVANAITGVLSRMDTLISGQGGNATIVLDSGELVGVMDRRLGDVQRWRGARRA